RPTLELTRTLYATNWLVMLLIQDLVAVVYSVVCITYWRGLWVLLDLYTPLRPNSLYIAHSVSFIVLAVCLTANSLLVRNVDRDGREGVVFDVRYVATMIQTLLHKKAVAVHLEEAKCPGTNHIPLDKSPAGSKLWEILAGN
ncbi:unnamed protein product, partial [Candidula unifasciata]